MIPDLSPEALAHLYNNRAWVPEYPEHLARWQASSAAFRAGAKYHADIRYGDRPRNRLDLFVPAAAARPVPLLVYIHGGYWQWLSKEDWSCAARPLVARGMAVAVVGYTLCPETTVAGIVDEIAAASALLYREADQHGLDRDAFCIAGHSAGGHLTAMMLTQDWPKRAAGLPPRLFQRGVAVSGVYDLEPLTRTPLNEALGLTPAEALAVSPMLRENTSGTPLLVLVGGAETPEFLRQSREFAATWENNEYLEFPALNHFSVIDAVLDPATPAFRTAWQYLTGASAAE